MKTSVHKNEKINSLLLLATVMLLSFSPQAQTYTTIANGAWSSASTWQGGNVPSANGTINSGVVINIKHIITYTGSNISNSGTINISNPGAPSPRLIVASGIDIVNKTTGVLNIDNGELRQYRFSGGGESGIKQTGNFSNNGGHVSVKNSFVEIAQTWTNQLAGTVVLDNSSLEIGDSYSLSSSIDSLINTSISVGMQGTGNYSVSGANSSVYFKSFKAEVASLLGGFSLGNGTANGSIDYITLKNHLTNTYSTGLITASSSIVASGLTLTAYCALTPLNYIPNGKFIGSQTLDCSLNYFPASLFGASNNANLNFSLNPVLIAGTDRQVGARYKYESVAPGMDAIVTIDSIVGGATLNALDDNTGSNGGYIEGFQPQITSGPIVGKSYAVFTFNYKISGTNQDQKLDNVSLTAVDIDGTSTLKEFDQISLGNGSSAGYVGANPSILLTQVASGAFLGINVDGITRKGVDTTIRGNMFTVSNTNTSSFTAKLGISNTKTTQELRLFSIYMKGFNYPNLITLPVTMESFSAVLAKNGKKIDLNWTTSSEINVSHFVVERSLDGSNFSDAGLVFASGNSSQDVNYSFPDDISSIHANIIYYRLRSVDNDDRIEYSDVRSVRISKQANSSIAISTYPNPVSVDLHVTIPSAWQNKKVSYELFTINGQSSLRVESQNSSATQTINISKLTKGMYIVQVNCEGQTAHLKIVKY